LTGTLALLVNARSKKARRDPGLVRDLEALFAGRGLFRVMQHPGELPATLADVRRNRTGTLFVAGGDGTLRQTLSRLVKEYGSDPAPRIAVLRGGTMNTVATSLGIRREPREQLRVLLERRDRGIPPVAVRRVLLKVNEDLGFIFAVGGFSRFVEEYEKAPDPSPARAVRLFLRTTASVLGRGSFASRLFEPFPARLRLDGRPCLDGTPVMTVSASAIRHIGFRFKPFHGAERPDGSFALLVLHAFPARLFLSLPRFFLGRPVVHPLVLQSPAHHVSLRLEGPLTPMLDGDLLAPGTDFEISAGPALEFVLG
jgi:diacylglycerol kinase (ATP)